MLNNFAINKKLSLYWLCQISGWIVLWIISSFLALFIHPSWKDFVAYFINACLGLLVSNILRNALKNKSINIDDTQASAIFIIKYSLSYGLIYFGVYCGSILSLHLKPLEHTELLLYIIGKLVSCIIIIFVWIIVYYAFHFVAKSKETELEKVKLENLIKNLELQNLKAHVNPHFMFNSLNTIRALVDIEPERARQAITELSHILRSSLKSDSITLTEFREELAIVTDYLALEKLRFDNRLEIRYSIEDGTLHQLMPPMILQTLVENAIKHGISNNIKGGFIEIKSTIRQSFFELSITNSGTLTINPDKLAQENSTGFGIYGTRERLTHIYQNAQIQINEILLNQEPCVQVILQIPTQKNHWDKNAYWEHLNKKYSK